MLPSLLACVHPLVRSWRGHAHQRDNAQSLDHALKSLVDEEAAAGFSEQMRALALPPRVFKSRHVEHDGLTLIACINFRDISGDYPFVRILVASEPPGSYRDRNGLATSLVAAFREFKPRAALFYQPDHLPPHAPTMRIDDHLLAAPACVMAARPLPQGSERVTLRHARDLSFYPRYVALYQEAYDERPQLKGEVRTESEASLEECRAGGHLYEILVDDVWSGIVAAKAMTLAGLHGLYMVEIVLGATARGKKLGPAVHYRLASEIVARHPETVVYGTIAARNPWSRQAALRAGRIEIGAWHWISL